MRLPFVNMSFADCFVTISGLHFGWVISVVNISVCDVVWRPYDGRCSLQSFFMVVNVCIGIECLEDESHSRGGENTPASLPRI